VESENTLCSVRDEEQSSKLNNFNIDVQDHLIHLLILKHGFN